MAATTTLPVLFATGNHAARPAAATPGVGALYSCTTHSLVYQTDGSSWTTWASLAGTGLTNPMTTTGDVIYSSDNSGTAARLAVGAAGKFLSGGTTPAWGQGPLTTTGDLLIGATGGTPTRLATGAAGTVLVGGTTPAWAQPPGYELDYVEFTAPVNITGTSEGAATAWATGSSVSYNGSTIVMIEWFAPYIDPVTTAGHTLQFYLYDGSGSIGRVDLVLIQVNGIHNYRSIYGRRRLTPSNASHTYSMRAAVVSGTGVIGAGAGGSGNDVPGFIRITKV